MTLKTKKKLIAEWVEKNVTEYFHWVLTAAPIFAAILAKAFGSDADVWALIFIVLAIIANLCLLWLRSRIEKNENLTLFHTFWSNNLLPPNRSGEELVIDIQVSIVEEQEKGYFQKRLTKNFKTKGKDGSESEPDLVLRPVPCRSTNKDGLNEAQQKTRMARMKKRLERALSKSDAVAVVRTDKLDDKSWVYGFVNDWAKKHADVPILFVRPRDRDSYQADGSADKFLWIQDDPKSLPWGLLTRAAARASAWRTQASYNRAMVVNILFLSLMLVHFGLLWIHAQKEENHTAIQNITNEYPAKIQGMYDAMELRTREHPAETQKIISEYSAAIKGMYEAMETKLQYQEEIIADNDSQLDVSYWVTHNGKPFVFVTTETERRKDSFENDKTSIIGCGFVDPSKIVGWRKGYGTRVFDFPTDDERFGHGCIMDPRVEPIQSIVCSAYKSSGASHSEATVGICVFTGSKNPVVVNGYQDFLRKRTMHFYAKFHESIENKTVTTLCERNAAEDADKLKVPPDQSLCR